MESSIWKKIVFLVVFMLVIAGSMWVISGFEKQPDSERIKLEELTIERRFKAAYQPNRLLYGQGKISETIVDKDCFRENADNLEVLKECSYTSKIYYFDVVEAFQNLPEIPEDFWWYKYKMIDHKDHYVDLCTLDESYWKQPEFIENTFVNSGIHRYKTPSEIDWIPNGYGSYPAVQWVEAPADSEFDLCYFIYASYGVSTQQGFQLVPFYVNKIYSPIEGVTYDTIVDKENIQMSLKSELVVIEETYPIFNYNWIHRIKIHVKLSEEIPAGDYGIAVDLTKPSDEILKEWSFKYRMFMPSSGFKVDFPQIQAMITVVEGNE